MENDFNNELFNFDTNLDANQSLNLSKLEDKIKLNFDYEMNDLKLEYDDTSLSYLDEKKTPKIINYDIFFDKLKPLPKIIPSDDPKLMKFNTSPYDCEFEEIENYEIAKEKEKVKTANFIKRLVSKQKRRFQDSNYDLDMSYVTEKVIAMGYPSSGIETMYRNSVSDITKFFHEKHNDQIKVYNLCLEKDRIYNKNTFPNSKVGLFPATDHNPCPIKLILEFCIDICLYLIKNPKGVAAVHCKAGKGRSGVMICSYLIFSGLCSTSGKAFRYYARVRTKNNTGITIASQKRYIRYFETFLNSNFYKPYINLIPKIIRSHFSFLIDKNDTIKIRNILESFQKQKSYFISANKFKLKGVKVGPLPKGKKISLKICNFINNNFDIKDNMLKEIETDNINEETCFYEIRFNPELIIHSDIKINFQGIVNFYVWVNLWYSSWENIKKFYDNEEYDEEKEKEHINPELLENTNIHQNDNIKNNKYVFESNDNIINTNEEKNMIIIKKDELSEGKFSEHAEKEKFEQFAATKSLYEIIYKLKHNTDLNELITRINQDLKNQFDKNRMKIVLNSSEFDKFEEKGKHPDLKTTIYYNLEDKFKE